MKIAFNFAGRINSRKLKKHPIYFCKSLSPTYVLFSIFALYHMHFRHYSLRIRISFKISFQCSLKLMLIKKFHGSSPGFHGTTFEQHLWFHGIPWNLSNKTSSSMEFHGTMSRSKVPWNSKELFPYSWVPWNSMELLIFRNKVPWNSMKFFEVPMNSIEVYKFDILIKSCF